VRGQQRLASVLGHQHCFCLLVKYNALYFAAGQASAAPTPARAPSEYIARTDREQDRWDL
jgi:hypothetical protein